MIRRLLIAFLPFAPTTLAMGAAAQGQEPSHPPELVALATELRQWQRDQPAGAPDFAEQAKKRKRELPEFRQRLHRLNPRNWPVHAQVDYLMLQAELDALDFRLNVIRETSKNPDFYLSQAVSRVTRHIGGRFQRAPGVTVPYDADRAAAIVQALTEIEAIVSQAPRALSGAVPELADVAIERTNGVRENCAELARVVGQHLPEPYASQIGPAAKRAAEALFQYREWLRENRASGTVGQADEAGR